MHTIKNIIDSVGGQLIGDFSAGIIKHWSFDTRLHNRQSNTCFLALEGKKRSGHDFIENAYNLGIRFFWVSKSSNIEFNRYPYATFILVDDVLKSVQLYAKCYRETLTGTKVIGITGSAGKTIVKEWVYEFLKNKNNTIYRSPQSFNSQLGVALSILQIPKNATVALIEAGISHPGEMIFLAKMIQPEGGLLTNIGDAHSINFTSKTQLVLEKLLLFSNTNWLITHHQDQLNDTRFNVETKKTIRWGKNSNDTIQVKVVNNKLIFKSYLSNFNNLEFSIPFQDSASIENLTNAIILALKLGGSKKAIDKKIKTLLFPDKRLQIVNIGPNALLVDDTYSADFSGLKGAIEFTNFHKPKNSKAVLILGELSESYKDIESPLVQLINTSNIEELYTVGDQLKELPFDIKVSKHFENTELLLDFISRYSTEGKTILLKGPRKMALERISNFFKTNRHSARLEINLNAISHNLNFFRSKLLQNTKMCIMLKASAYGAGSRDLVTFLENQNIDYFAVANLDEGIELRKTGCKKPILVANCPIVQFDQLIHYGLELAVTSIEILNACISFATRKNIVFPIHLKLDSGMHRFGFDITKDNGEAFMKLKELVSDPNLNIISIYSHFAASDVAEGKALTLQQFEYFSKNVKTLTALLPNHIILHVSNSNAILRYPEYQLDMVRLGIGLFGILDGSKVEKHLEPAHHFVGKIVEIKHIEAGEYIGYGLNSITTKAIRIGIVNVGYADGFRRQAGNGNFSLFVRHQQTPTIGNICMDFCMIDLTNCPQATLNDDAIIFNDEHSIHELAKCYDTIPYEILTTISPRIRRVYYK